MSNLDDLKRSIGKTVYFKQPIIGMRLSEPEICSGTLERVDDITAVVTWRECLCLDWHDETVGCDFEFRERLSVFALQTTPPLALAR